MLKRLYFYFKQNHIKDNPPFSIALVVSFVFVFLLAIIISLFDFLILKGILSSIYSKKFDVVFDLRHLIIPIAIFGIFLFLYFKHLERKDNG